MDNQKQPKNQVIWIVVIVVVLALAAYGVWIATFRNNRNISNSNNANKVNYNINQNINQNNNTNQNPIINTSVDTTSWQIYVNTNPEFSFKYPADYYVQKSRDNLLVVAKIEYVNRHVGIPAISINWEKKPEGSLRNWITGQQEVTEQLFEIPGSRFEGYWFERQYPDNRVDRVAYIINGDNVYTLYLAAFFDHDMVDVFNGMVLSYN